MSSFDISTFDLNTEYDFSDIEFPLTTPEPQSPLSSVDWDWLDAIPIHDQSTTPEPPSSATDDSYSESSNNSTPEQEPMEFDPILNYRPPSPHKYSLFYGEKFVPQQQEEPTPKPPPIQYLPIEEVINFSETWDLHRGFARASLGLHGVPRSMYERWEEFDHLESDEIYRMISFFQAFNPEEKLTEWQQQFQEDYKKIADPPCIFCKLPKNYWCERVATSLS